MTDPYTDHYRPLVRALLVIGLATACWALAILAVRSLAPEPIHFTEVSSEP